MSETEYVDWCISHNMVVPCPECKKLETELEDFLLARLTELKNALGLIGFDDESAIHTIINSQMEVVKLGKDWPVMLQKKPVETEIVPTFELDAYDKIRVRVHQEVEWITQQEYIKRFGRVSAMAPFIRTLLMGYTWHPDFKDEWL